MNKNNLLMIFLLGFLAACSDETGGRTPDAGREGNTPPRVVSATVYPDKATANTTLIAQYRDKDREGDVIQYTFRWYVDNEIVQEGSASTLEPGKHRKGSEVYVEIVPQDSGGAGKIFKTNAVVIGNHPPQVKSVSVSPVDPKVGDQLTASAEAADPDGDDIRYTYQWFVNGKAVSEPVEDKTFSTTGLRKKDHIFVVITPFDRDGLQGEPKSSDYLRLLNRPPEITSVPLYAINEGWYTYQAAAKDPDGDRLIYALVKSPAGMTIDPQTGLVRWAVPLQVAEKKEVPVKIKVDDSDGGSAYQEYSLVLEMN